MTALPILLSSNCTRPNIQANEYFIDRAITCSYQFNPELYNPDVVINILVKALTAAPPPDFNLCVALLGERQVGRSSFLCIVHLTDSEMDVLASVIS